METFKTRLDYKIWIKAQVGLIRKERKDNGYSWKKHLLSKQFRNYHIAYCMLRGRKYECIERKVREGNLPNWDLINKLILAHKEIFDEKNVRPSEA